MKILSIFIFLLFFYIPCFSQSIKSVNCDFFYRLILENEDAIIIDVRPIEMYKKNRIENSIFGGTKDSLILLLKEIEYDVHLLLYCKIGERSKQCSELLKEMGYKNVYELRGGLKDWIKNGFPIDSTKIKF